MAFDVPILFLVFNRPDTTEKVFKKIREVQPEELFIAADGPRIGKEGEAGKCKAVRKFVLESIDWPCKVRTNFRDTNLGCGLAVSSAISWFFEQIEEGIILEDDILVDSSFFEYCKELLIKYRNNDQIRFINGCNFGYKGLINESYGFTRFMNMWGWAAWKRSINLIDFKMKEWELLGDKKKFLFDYFEFLPQSVRKKAVDRFYKIFNETAEGQIDTWDYQVIFSNMLTGSLVCYPSLNLVSNIGYGSDATHANFESYYLDALVTSTLTMPLIQNQSIKPETKYEKFVLERWEYIRNKPRLYYSFEYRYFKLKKFLSKLNF